MLFSRVVLCILPKFLAFLKIFIRSERNIGSLFLNDYFIEFLQGAENVALLSGKE